MLPTDTDQTPPVTTLALSTAVPRDPGGLPVFAAARTLPLSATDAGGSGLLVTEYRLGAGEYENSLQAPGSTYSAVQTLYYRSWDRDRNLEKTSAATIHIDALPPVVSAVSPATGTFVAGRDTPTVTWGLADDLDPAPTAQAFLVRVDSVAAPVPVAMGAVLPFSQLGDGYWEVMVNAQDWVKNSTVAYGGTFRVVHGDTQPPRTQLTLGPPSVPGDPLAGTPAFVSSSTVLTLASVDDLTSVGDGLGLGVATLTYVLDGATVNVAGSSVSFVIAQEGLHHLLYGAVDRAGNAEAVHLATAAVDSTPPVTSQSFTGPTVDIDSAVIVGPATRLVLASTDPVSNGVASGLAGSLVYVDTTPAGCGVALSTVPADTNAAEGTCADPLYRTSLQVAAGTHTVSFLGLDNVQNAGVLQSTVDGERILSIGDRDPIEHTPEVGLGSAAPDNCIRQPSRGPLT